MAHAKRRSLAGRIKDETDPEWKRWYEQVEWRRQRLASAKHRPLVVSRFEIDGQERLVARKKSVPTALRAVVKNMAGLTQLNLQMNLAAIRDAWNTVVGEEISEDTSLYSFKKGVLTIEVFSPTLLQEIRMFHAKAILQDVRDAWPAETPLLQIKYRPGRKSTSDAD